MRTLIFLLTLALFACNRHVESDFYDAVNDNFLTIADTNAYRFNSFFAFPGQSEEKYSPKDSFFVSFCDTVIFNKELRKIISLELMHTPDFTEVLKNPLDIRQIKTAHINNTGQFVLIPKFQNRPLFKRVDTIGELSFYTPFVYNNKAILCYKKSISQKAGAIYMLLLKKRKGKWIVVQKKEIERW